MCRACSGGWQKLMRRDQGMLGHRVWYNHIKIEHGHMGWCQGLHSDQYVIFTLEMHQCLEPSCLYLHNPWMLYLETGKCIEGHSCWKIIMRDSKESAEIWLNKQYLFRAYKVRKNKFRIMSSTQKIHLRSLSSTKSMYSSK